MEALTFITPVHLALVPIVIGLVSIAKGLSLSTKLAPILAIALGIGGTYLIGGTIMAVIIGGIVVGLTASGLYSGSAAMAKQ